MLGILCCTITFLWLRLLALERQRENDCKYFDYWMRSLEQRKEDKPDLSNADYEEQDYDC